MNVLCEDYRYNIRFATLPVYLVESVGFGPLRDSCEFGLLIRISPMDTASRWSVNPDIKTKQSQFSSIRANIVSPYEF
jgi:hypothetical protein